MGIPRSGSHRGGEESNERNGVGRNASSLGVLAYCQYTTYPPISIEVETTCDVVEDEIKRRAALEGAPRVKQRCPADRALARPSLLEIIAPVNR